MSTSRRWQIVLALALSPALLAPGCSEEEQPCTDGQEEQNGPQCCAGGCGNSTSNWLPRICVEGTWVCQGEKGVVEDACASPTYACIPMDGCHVVGLGREEPDPAPELCCEGGCAGTKAVHRVCNSGTLWECPAGTKAVSTCEDYLAACDGILQRYRDNGYKLP